MSIFRFFAGAGVNPKAWDLSYAQYQPSSPWNISTAFIRRNFSVAAQTTSPKSIFFKPDGTKMYALAGGGIVYEYDLSTPWDVSSAAYLQSFSVGAQEGNPTGLFFKPDGTKMYILGIFSDDVNEYNLSTPWDVSSAAYLQSFSVVAQEEATTGIFFKPDGIKMYILGDAGNDVNEYDLSTPWDVSSAAYLQSFSVGAQETNPEGIFFKPDGTKMYILGDRGNDVNEYDLSTPWDVSSAAYLQSFFIGSTEGNPTGIFFKPDGLKMYVVGEETDAVYEYDFGKFPFTVNKTDIFFKPDGFKMYVLGANEIHEYDLSVAWDVSSALYLQGFPLSVSTTGGTAGLFFKPDGTKMYYSAVNDGDVKEYFLTTPWSVSSALYLNNYSVGVDQQGLFFKPDGSKMYLVRGGSTVEHDLSTPWDVSSGSFLQSFSLSAQDGSPKGIFFKPDGSKMFVVGDVGNDINEYRLSTPWDVSSASYLRNFSVAAQTTFPQGVSFKPDGLQMYVVSNAVFQYNFTA